MILAGKDRGVEPITTHDLYRKKLRLESVGKFVYGMDGRNRRRTLHPRFSNQPNDDHSKDVPMDDSFGFIPKSIAQKDLNQGQLFEWSCDFPRPLPKHYIYAMTLKSNDNNRYAKMGLA